MKVLLALLVFLAVLAAASQLHFPSGPAGGADEGEVQAVLDAYVRANRAKDAKALVTLYDDDAMLLPPDEPPVRGKAGILAFWLQGVEPGLDVVPLRVEIHGDAAVIVGSYTVPEQDGTPADSGKCVLLLHRRGRGRWKVSTDIWNTSSPRSDAQDDSPDGDSDSSSAIRTSMPGARQVLWTMLQRPR